MFMQVCNSSDYRSDTSITTDIDTDDPSRQEYVSHSRSHTISDMELDCQVAKLKKRKVYRKKKGEQRSENVARLKGYLSPTVSGDSLTEIIERCNHNKEHHTEVDVEVETTQSTESRVKLEPPDKISGNFK